MRASEITLVWRLFLADLEVNRKRILLTIIAIGWGTLSIVLPPSFGEGLKRAFHEGKRGMGEGIGILWPGNTTRTYAGLPSGRPITFTDEDAEEHRAFGSPTVLVDGRDVVVKVQRPGIDQVVERDLDVLLRLVTLIERRARSSRPYQLVSLATEFASLPVLSQPRESESIQTDCPSSAK